jgi:hypothetical protein
MRLPTWPFGYRAEERAMGKLRLWVMAMLGAALLLAAACKTAPPAGQSAAGGGQATSATSSESEIAGYQAPPGTSGQPQAAAKAAVAPTQAAAGQQTLTVARSTDRSGRTSSNPARVASTAPARTPSRKGGALQALEKLYDSVKKRTIDSEDFRGTALAVLILLGMSGFVVALALNARRRRKLTPSSLDSRL